MVRLIFESKFKPPVTDEEYKVHAALLKEAEKGSGKNIVVKIDLEGEDSKKFRKGLLYVAEQEGIGILLSYKRSEGLYTLRFRGASAPASRTARISAEESRAKILGVLKASGRSMTKSEILEEAGISGSVWNLRIKELIKSGDVKKKGALRNTKYSV